MKTDTFTNTLTVDAIETDAIPIPDGWKSLQTPYSISEYGWLLTWYRLTDGKQAWVPVLEVLCWRSQIWLRTVDDTNVNGGGATANWLPDSINGYTSKDSLQYARQIHHRYAYGSYRVTELFGLPPQQCQQQLLGMELKEQS